MKSRTIGLGLLWSLTCPALPAMSQDASGAHQHHAVTAPAAASLPAGATVMDPQPHVGDVRLVDSRGRVVSLADAVGGDAPVLVNFIFTSCTTICPVMSAGFAQLSARLHAERRSVRLVSITIDPEYDTPSRLREYGVKKHGGPDWVFLTGSLTAVEAAQRAFSAYRGGGKENHRPDTYLKRSAKEPWVRLTGLSSADALLRAYAGSATEQRH